MVRTILAPESVDAATTLPLTENVLTMTAADVANGNRFRATGREVLIVQNSHASTTYNVKFQSVARGGRQDPKHNVNQAVPAGEIRIYSFLGEGFRQISGADVGYVQVDADNAAIKLCVLTLPQ